MSKYYDDLEKSFHEVHYALINLGFTHRVEPHFAGDNCFHVYTDCQRVDHCIFRHPGGENWIVGTLDEYRRVGVRAFHSWPINPDLPKKPAAMIEFFDTDRWAVERACRMAG